MNTLEEVSHHPQLLRQEEIQVIMLCSKGRQLLFPSLHLVFQLGQQPFGNFHIDGNTHIVIAVAEVAQSLEVDDLLQHIHSQIDHRQEYLQGLSDHRIGFSFFIITTLGLLA